MDCEHGGSAMGYCLDAQETVSNGVRRIAWEQLDKAVECTQPHARPQDEAVHDIRVAFKKLRALLRLVRTKSKDPVLSRENACYRDAGRLLSEVRDTTAILAALDKLIEHSSGHLARHAFDDVRKPFVSTEKTQRPQKKHAIAEVARMLASARRRVAHWPIDHEGFSALRRGLKHTYTRGRTAQAQVHVTPTVETLHEWRKRVKDLGYQVRLLKPMWPELLGSLADELERLADFLSDNHDLAILRQALKKLPLEEETQTEALVDMIDQRRSELEVEAQHVGARIYGEKPNDFVRRFDRYWESWCAEMKVGRLSPR
ncbi:MAG: CHAD domain-containing protein [Nitrospirales bacterium]